MKKLADEKRDEILKLYQTGKEPLELATQFGIAERSVFRLLRRHGVLRLKLIRLPRSPESDKIIVDEYLSGTSSEVIAKIHKSNGRAICRVLKENGVELRPSTQNKRKYKINEDFFETIDTEEKAYFLGLLYADGNLSQGGTGIKILLHEKDIDILEKFSNIIYGFMKYRESEATLEDGSISRYITINIYSQKMHEDLCKLGCVPAKTFKIRLPTNNMVPDHLMHHFIRGHFDGDGCICITEPSRPRIDISSNCMFIQDIIQYFTLHNLEFYRMGVNDENNLSGSTQMKGKERVINFYNHIYKDATIYINRKYNTFQKMFELLQEIEDSKGKDFSRYGTEYIPKYNGKVLIGKNVKDMPDTDKELLTEFLFDFYRENGFPYVKLTNDELLADFNQLKNIDTTLMEKDHNLLTSYRAGLPNFKHFSPHFYEVNSSEKDRLSMLDTFNDDKLLKDVIRNRINGEFNLSGNMLKQGLANSKLAFKASIFNPSIAKFIYQKYTNANDIVYDYSAGFGQRLLGALSVEHSLTYVGVDPMQRSIDSNNNIFSFYKNNVPMFNKQAELVCIGSENYKDPKYEGQISLAFSSPAYYNHEVYEDNSNQAYFSNSYIDFINKWWRQTVLNIKYLLKPQGLLALNIKDKLELFDLGTDMKNVLIEYGFTLIDTYQIQITRNNIFSRKDGKFKYEPIYIFQKE
jgi:hypothetical protein